MPWFNNRRGSRLWFQEQGTGFPLIFLHGWCMSSNIWALQIRNLSSHFRIIAPDMRGHGSSGDGGGEMTVSSCVEDLEDLLDYTGVSTCVLVGWSLGAQVAMSAFPLLGNRLSGFALVAATPCFVMKTDFCCGLPANDVAGMRFKVIRNLDRAVKGFVNLMFSMQEQQSETFFDHVMPVVDSIVLPRLEAALAGLRMLEDTDLRSSLPELTLPVLIIGGNEDRITPHTASVSIARSIPRSRLITFSGCGHAPFLTHEIPFDHELAQFVRGIVFDED